MGQRIEDVIGNPDEFTTYILLDYKEDKNSRPNKEHFLQMVLTAANQHKIWYEQVHQDDRNEYEAACVHLSLNNLTPIDFIQIEMRKYSQIAYHSKSNFFSSRTEPQISGNDTADEHDRLLENDIASDEEEKTFCGGCCLL